MGLVDILSAERVSVSGEAEGLVRTKSEALARLASLLSSGREGEAHEIERILGEREKLSTTGVGGGVAIPHGTVDRLERLVGAVLLCPEPVDFDAIDGAPVSIFFSVIGPKRATAEHLKTLARVSRLLREDHFRERLLAAKSGAEAFQLIAAEEGRVQQP